MRISKRARPAARRSVLGATAMALAVAFVGQWEGLRLSAYRDIVGVPTVCYGETKGVQMGDSYTKAECDDMFVEELESYAAQLAKVIPALPEMPPEMQVAFTSWAYNVGLGAAAKSTLARKANAGDWVGACEQLPRWNRAGGRAVRGLTLRRSAEREMCLEGARGMRV